jgi:hypothetical protein
MELYKFKIDGIYDLRTLSELKKEGVDHFSFDFNPRSFNFIQERVFLKLLDSALNETDKVFLHFISNKDFMVIKIREEIVKRRGNLHNIFFEFEEFFSDIILPKDIKFFLFYGTSIFQIHQQIEQVAGFIFQYNHLNQMEREERLIQFFSNFHTHFSNADLDSKIFILKTGWQDNINKKCLDIFDFNIISFELTSEIEVCYRNVDLLKLKSTFDSKRKKINTHDHF